MVLRIITKSNSTPFLIIPQVLICFMYVRSKLWHKLHAEIYQKKNNKKDKYVVYKRYNIELIYFLLLIGLESNKYNEYSVVDRMIARMAANKICRIPDNICELMKNNYMFTFAKEFEKAKAIQKTYNNMN